MVKKGRHCTLWLQSVYTLFWTICCLLRNARTSWPLISRLVFLYFVRKYVRSKHAPKSSILVTQPWECDFHLSRRISNYESSNMVYGGYEWDFCFTTTRCPKYLLPLCNSISFSQKAWAWNSNNFLNLKFSQKSTCILPPCPSIHTVMPSTLCGPSWLAPPRVQPMPQYSPCHSPFRCLYSPGPHIVAWVLGEHGPSPLSCHCAPQCQTPSGKGPGPRPCCYFWPEQKKVKGRWCN